MIERKLLYYPTIVVPSRWLRWAVFYWDKVSSIVPYDWERRPLLTTSWQKDHFKTMKYLWRREEFEPTRPRHLLRRRSTRSFREEFIETVSSPQFQISIRKDWVRSPGRIHKDKFTKAILDFLVRLKLAREDPHDTRWFLVEEKTSLLYMALLAKHLSDVDPDYTIPSTDWDEYENMIYLSDDIKSAFPCLKAKFLNVLPIPREDVSIKDILKFKKKRKDELFQFRSVIDEFQRDMSRADSNDEIKQISVQFKERIQLRRSNLEKSMKDSGIKKAFAIFRSLINIKSPALYETLGFSIAQTPLRISLPIIIGTVVVQVGSVWVDNRNKQRVEIRDSPFSYLYYAKQEKMV